MSNQLKLMCVLAHPDDESLGTGGILARYAAEGIDAALIVATRGEYGWAWGYVGRIPEIQAWYTATGTRPPALPPVRAR